MLSNGVSHQTPAPAPVPAPEGRQRLPRWALALLLPLTGTGGLAGGHLLTRDKQCPPCELQQALRRYAAEDAQQESCSPPCPRGQTCSGSTCVDVAAELARVRRRVRVLEISSAVAGGCESLSGAAVLGRQ